MRNLMRVLLPAAAILAATPASAALMVYSIAGEVKTSAINNTYVPFLLEFRSDPFTFTPGVGGQASKTRVTINQARYFFDGAELDVASDFRLAPDVSGNVDFNIVSGGTGITLNFHFNRIQLLFIEYDGLSSLAPTPIYLYDGLFIGSPHLLIQDANVKNATFAAQYNPGTGTGGAGGGEGGTVPEPASWAMLIAGFGLTGAAMRRRRAALV